MWDLGTGLHLSDPNASSVPEPAAARCGLGAPGARISVVMVTATANCLDNIGPLMRSKRAGLRLRAGTGDGELERNPPVDIHKCLEEGVNNWRGGGMSGWAIRCVDVIKYVFWTLSLIVWSILSGGGINITTISLFIYRSVIVWLSNILLFKGWGSIKYLMFLKEVSYAHQGCIYFRKISAAKLQFQITFIILYILKCNLFLWRQSSCTD